MQFDNSVVGKTIRALRKEKGSKQANFETLWRLATALGLRPSELVAQIERRIEASENY